MRSVRLADVRAMALALPGTDEGTSYGTPAFRVRGRLFARLHEDGESLVVKVDPDARDSIVRAAPETFHVTDHYRSHPMMLVRLSRIERDDLDDVLRESWRRAAPKRLAARLSEEA